MTVPVPTQPDETTTQPKGPDSMTTASGLTNTSLSPESSSSIVGGAIAGVIMSVAIIVVCVILVFVKCLSMKKLQTHNQLGATYGNTVQGKSIW